MPQPVAGAPGSGSSAVADQPVVGPGKEALVEEEEDDDAVIVLDDASEDEQPSSDTQAREAESPRADEPDGESCTELACAACEADLAGDFVSVHAHARLGVALCGRCAHEVAEAEAEGALDGDGGEEWCAAAPPRPAPLRTARKRSAYSQPFPRACF